MEDVILQAAVRTETGKNASRRLRREGKVPAIFYGTNYESRMLTVILKDLNNTIAKKPSLVKLQIEGQEYEVIFREIQLDPVSDKIEHVDFLGITRGTKLEVTVKVEMTGIPEGVKNSGGVLEIHRRRLRVECFPKDIPSSIQIDVSGLEINESVLIKDLHYPELTFLHNLEHPIATVVSPTVAKAAVTVEEAPAEGADQEGTSGESESEKK
ncbi:50S ribosomal protein L25 [bacterium]|nr:50S ribosomal protein L25 [FCB group bacterium]MBL7192138.1 50S ribosomal protein L25 [bacterium]